MNIKKTADEILSDWFGPNGMCWCKKKREFIHPDRCTVKECPECIPLERREHRLFRYIQENDYTKD